MQVVTPWGRGLQIVILQTEEGSVFYSFPDDFDWCAGTSAPQIEGAWNEDGKGESIWDRFCRTPGKIMNGHTLDVACDHYHRYRDDIALMGQLGLRSYRFSIAWPRIFPEGKGRLNQAGVDFYSRLVDELLSRGINPKATLYHWDLPQKLEEAGGWPNRDTAKYFGDYAEAIARKLGDRVKFWMTINEPSIVMFMGYMTGEFAPGIKNRLTALKVAHHLLLAHGYGMQALRQTVPDAKAGIVWHLLQVERLSDTLRARAGEWFWWNLGARWFIEPVLLGSYPKAARLLYRTILPVIRDGDMKLISQPMDMACVNYYMRQLIGSDGHWLEHERLPGSEYTSMGWEISPGGLLSLLLRLKQLYPAMPTIYLTEIGAAFEETLENGQVNDWKRIQYLGDHLVSCFTAIARGVKLGGLSIWTLFNNFEWPKGYTQPFGLIYVDWATQQRVIKASGHWYSQVIAQNGFEWPLQGAA
jgi:beta-glucosidase